MRKEKLRLRHIRARSIFSFIADHQGNMISKIITNIGYFYSRNLMNNIRYHMLALLMLSGSALYAMEGRDSPLTAPSDSNVSPVSLPSPTPVQKKNIRFPGGIKGDTNIKPRESSTEAKEAYQKEQAAIENEQIIAQLEALNELSPEDALKDLLSFAKNAIPDIEHMIDSCANDILEVWKFFSAVPSNEAMAKEHFAQLSLAIKDYEVNAVSIRNRVTGAQSDSVIDEYQDKLLTLKELSLYESKNITDASVKQLDHLISNFKKLVINKAMQRYIALKKPELDRIFSQISPDANAKDQYAEAVSYGYEFLDNKQTTENAVDAAMKKYRIRKYSKYNYSTYLHAKQQGDKNMVIERVWPYAEKIKQPKDALYHMF
jgi:hypothetical protein